MSVGHNKILTIDDDEDIRTTLCDLLKLEGYETVWAKNGLVALDYLRSVSESELPDLVLLDHEMPVMNGESFLQEKKKDPKLAKIPVVMMTAGRNLMNALERVQPGAFMTKPMDFDTVVQMVKNYI